MPNRKSLKSLEGFLMNKWLKSNAIILFRQTDLLDVFWEIWNWDSSKVRISISIHHCAKRVRIRSYSGPHFSRTFPHSDWIRRDTEYLSIFTSNAGKSWKNAGQNNSEYGLFLCSASSAIIFFNISTGI